MKSQIPVLKKFQKFQLKQAEALKQKYVDGDEAFQNSDKGQKVIANSKRLKNAAEALNEVLLHLKSIS